MEEESPNASGKLPDQVQSKIESGFIKFYGIFWRKDCVDWSNKRLLGRPPGWTGSGKTAKGFDNSTVQVNFWGQKGVYVLYDSSLSPVYAGQAGLARKNATGGQSIGDRILTHSRGIYRNGWVFFSWFGFLNTGKINLKVASEESRMSPVWHFQPADDGGGNDLNLLLASFEAILIEGFAPRFNARGGDLGKAILIDQFEGHLKASS